LPRASRRRVAWACRSRSSRSIGRWGSTPKRWPRPRRAPAWCSSATNNPTEHGPQRRVGGEFVRRVKQSSPGTRILIDEAYIDYVHDAAVKTAAPLTQELAGVFITRSFSKAHGMAGLRLGYAIGQPETMQAISRAWGLGSVNTLTAAAGIASLKDTAHMDAERSENARVRDFTLQAFRDLGYEGTDSHTNCIFIDLKRPASEFREACEAQKVRVGRDFPPFEKTHSRISLGTMEEMAGRPGLPPGVDDVVEDGARERRGIRTWRRHTAPPRRRSCGRVREPRVTRTSHTLPSGGHRDLHFDRPGPWRTSRGHWTCPSNGLNSLPTFRMTTAPPSMSRLYAIW
jgi:hypothetical protein